MTKRHFDLRGMSLDQIVATAAAAFDERFEEAIDDAASMVRDHGGTEDEIEAMCERSRQMLEQGRKAELAELRAWLERGGEPLQ